jgi:hypothetical protein
VHRVRTADRQSAVGGSMRNAVRSILVGSLVAAVPALLTGCGGSSGSAAKASSGSTSSTSGVPAATPAALGLVDALITTADLPPGWKDAPTPDPATLDADPTGGPCNGPNLSARLQQAGSSTGRVNRAFTRDAAVGPQLDIDVASFSTAAEASAFMDLTRATTHACTTYSAPVPGSGTTPVTITLSDLQFAPLGDDTIAIGLAADTATGAYRGADVFIRRGSLVASLHVDGTMDPPLLAAIAAAELRRLQAVR